jgi:hypothetical protein
VCFQKQKNMFKSSLGIQHWAYVSFVENKQNLAKLGDGRG